MPSHPQIKPWLRPVGRRHGEVQFGILPDAAVISGVTTAEVHLLGRLDGSLSRAASFRAATRAGVSSARWRTLLHLVDDLGLLVPAPGTSSQERTAADTRHPDEQLHPSPLRRLQPAPHVLIDGVGPIPLSITALLLACGTRVTQSGPAADLIVAAPEQDPPDVAVLVGDRAIDPRRGDLWLAHGIPALPVLVTGPWAAVGPLVEGDPDSPCLWCLDLHRTDRDREWPTLMAQLVPEDQLLVSGPVTGPDPDPALAHLVAGTVALLIQRVLLDERPPPAISVELSLPWPRMDHRRWARHPVCRRHRDSDPVGA